MNKDEIIKKILDQHKPDEQQAMQVIQQANATIKMLSNAVKEAQNQWRECFIMLATVINKFDKEIVLEQDDLIAISPDDYQITIEPVGEQRIIRLRHVTYREEDD